MVRSGDHDIGKSPTLRLPSDAFAEMETLSRPAIDSMTVVSNRSSYIETEHSFSVRSARTFAIASSICFGVTDFKDSTMTISHEKMKAHLGRFATVFPIPTQANADEFVAVWVGALRDYDERDISVACHRLLLSCRQFPAIADVVYEIREAQATPNVEVRGGRAQISNKRCDVSRPSAPAKVRRLQW